MKIIKIAETDYEKYAEAEHHDSTCCGDDCVLKCKKCPPMRD